MCDCELQICCCKECESAFKNSVRASASALTNQDVLVYATASASASSEKSFEDAWLKADVEANRLAKYYAELEANTIDTTFNIIETRAISTYEINNETDITTDTLTATSIETDTLTVGDISTTTGITNTGDITTDTLNNITVAQIDSELLNVIIGDSAANVTTASSNVALGIGALENLTTGTNNVAVGTYALSSNTEGSYNTVIGDSADFGSNGPYDYSTAIGYNSQITHSNQIVLGTSNEIVKILGGLAGSYEIITSANTNLNPLSIPLKTFYTIVLTGAGTIYLPFLETTTGYYIASSVKFKNMTAFNVTIETQLTSNGQQNYIIKNQQTVTTTTFVLLPGYSINLSFAINASNQGIWYE